VPDSFIPVEGNAVGRIQLGVIGRAHGVRGLVKITSHTADPAGLTAYGPLSDANGRSYALRWISEGVAEVSQIVDGVPVKVTDRAQAEKLTNTKLFIDRSALPPADEDEFYLADLIGLAVVDPAGVAVGTVSVVHDYGAGASLEIERHAAASLLIPFTAACVPTVDIAGRRLIVAMPDEIVVAPDAGGTVASDPDLIVPSKANNTAKTAPNAKAAE
jgi:16S rRNA processing protein RimM